LRALSLCTCCRHYPGTATGGTALLIRPVMSAFPERVVGSACAMSISRLARRSLALRPAHSRCHLCVARLPEGFRHFVTSMPAPVASGWSGCRAGLAPAGKRRLFTAHTHQRHPRPRIRCLEAAGQTKARHLKVVPRGQGQLRGCGSPASLGSAGGPAVAAWRDVTVSESKQLTPPLDRHRPTSRAFELAVPMPSRA
jgi:hypothetical protein